MTDYAQPTTAYEIEPVPDALLAPRMRRLIAYTIDVIPFTIILSLVVRSVTDYGEVWAEFSRDRRNLDNVLTFYLYRSFVREGSFVLYVLYSGVMDASPLQGTLGKYALGIKVVDSAGERLTPARAIARNLVKIASYAMCSVGFIGILLNKRRQGWHDRAADTLVVQR